LVAGSVLIFCSVKRRWAQVVVAEVAVEDAHPEGLVETVVEAEAEVLPVVPVDPPELDLTADLVHLVVEQGDILEDAQVSQLVSSVQQELAKQPQNMNGNMETSRATAVMLAMQQVPQKLK